MATKTQSSPRSQSIVGTIHRFGKNGVLYEVLHEVDDESVMIRVIDTNEETLYPIAEILKDPTN